MTRADRREISERLGGDSVHQGIALETLPLPPPDLDRVLADAGSSYQKTRTWCPTGTAERKRKAGVVRVVDPRTEEKRG